MKSILVLFYLMLVCCTSNAQQVPFDPFISCSTDSSFLTNLYCNSWQTSDIHIDKRGNYHVVGFEGGTYLSKPMMIYRKYSKLKQLLYQRISANPSIGEDQSKPDYLNSVTTDDSLNYYYTGQYLKTIDFRFNFNILYSGYISGDFAFLAKHDSLNNLKKMILLTPIGGNAGTGTSAFTDIVYLNGKLYTLLNNTQPANILSYNFSTNNWATIQSNLSIGMYLLEFNTNGNLLSTVLVNQAVNTVPNVFYNCSGAFGYYNSKAATLSIDKQHRILIHSLNQSRFGSIEPISYGPTILSTGDYTNTAYPRGVSVFSVYDTQQGFLSGEIIEKGNLTNITACRNNVESDIHGNKYILTNNIPSQGYITNHANIINHDTLTDKGSSISKLDAYGHFIWNKLFFNCNIVDMRLSKDEKHIGLIINSPHHVQYGTDHFAPFDGFSFGDSISNLDTINTTGYNAFFLRFSKNGTFENIERLSNLYSGQFLNIDDDGYFIYNAWRTNGRPIAIKLNGDSGQCTGNAYSGSLSDTLFIHLPKKELCSNTSLYIPWVATPSYSLVNIGYYINGGTTKNYIATNLNSQTFGYLWAMPNVIIGADSLKLFIENTTHTIEHQIGYYPFHSNKNIITWSDTLICKGTPLQIIPNNPANLTWLPSSYFTNNLLDSTQVITTLINTHVYISEQYTNTTCMSYDTVSIRVIPEPIAAFNYTLLPSSLVLTSTSSNYDSLKWHINNLTIANQTIVTSAFVAPTSTICLYAKNKCTTDTFCQTIQVHYSTKDSLAICANDSIYTQHHWQHTTGTYIDSLNSILNVDSIITKKLVVHPTKSLFKTITLCGNDSAFIGGHFQHSSGIYKDTLNTFFGCDSIVTTTLIYNSSYFTNTIKTMCASDSAYLKGHYQHVAGLYKDSLHTIHGCDSIIHTQLTIVGVNVSTTINGTTIWANTANATYQWINCNLNTLIVGATSQSYNPSINGNYACIITENNCKDTTGCVTIANVGLNQLTQTENVFVYPNPAKDIFYIEMLEVGYLEIVNVLSEVVFKKELLKTKNEINSSILPNGLYLLKIQLENSTLNTMLIKKD